MKTRNAPVNQGQLLQPIYEKLNRRLAADLQQTAGQRLESTIRQASSFRKILDQGEKIVTREAIFFFQECRELKTKQETAYGIIASKAVGGAVDRNRCKRLLRETFRLTIKRADNPVQGLKIVVIARKNCVSAELSTVLTSLVWALNKRLSQKRSA